MIDIDTSFYPLVVVRFFHSGWNISQFFETLEYLIKLLQTRREEKLKLFIIGNKDIGLDCAPSTIYLIRVAGNIIKNINVFRDNIDFTVIFQPNDSLDFFFGYLLGTFTARNPLHTFKDMGLVYTWLNEHGIEQSCLDIVCEAGGYSSSVNQTEYVA